MTENMHRSRLVVVLGMHRSGTSAITRGLQVMGVELGPRLMPAAEGDNPKGYWEDLDVNSLNVEMLQKLDRRWYSATLITGDEAKQLFEQEFAQRAIDLLLEKVDGFPVFGLKDPRFCALIPFWERVFDHCQLDVSYVFAIRNPLSVVKSLANRGEIDVVAGYMLWLGHVLQSLQAKLGTRNVVIDYDHLLADPESELNRAASQLALQITPAGLESYRNDFLDETLRHGQHDLRELDRDDNCPPLVREVYSTLLEVAADRLTLGSTEFKRSLDRWVAQTQHLSPFFSFSDRATNRNYILKEKYADEKQLNGTLTSETSRLNGMLKSERRVAKTEIERLNQLLESERNAATVEIQRLNDSLSAATAETQRLNDSLSAATAEIQRLNDSLSQVFSSRSWKLTSPLRRIGYIARVAPSKSKQWAISALRKTYHRLPLSTVERNRLKGAFYRRFPKIFSHTLSYRLWATQARGFSLAQPIIQEPHPTSDDPKIIDGCFDLICPEKPIVSIVIPVYGKVGYTYRCLRSLWSHRSSYSFEVIVVDDFSPDETRNILHTIRGIRVIENDENLGFIRSCNLGASQARGQLLVMLNNDTIVRPGWLNELVNTFNCHAKTGLVGSKLIYPDGRLQEAGGIIWQDGSGWNYGKLQDPNAPEHSYLRDVDYCSGASLMITKKLYFDLGGFDEHYAPAYGEDSDLAFRVREAGYRVLYQPLSQVVHFEGITSGKDLSAGVKAYQVANARKLFERWEKALASHGEAGFMPDLEKDRNISGRALFLDHCTPTPDQDAGSITAVNLMRIVQSLGFKVTFIPEDNFLHVDPYTSNLQRIGVECVCAPTLRRLQNISPSMARHSIWSWYSA